MRINRGPFFWRKRKAKVIWGKKQPKERTQEQVERSLQKLFKGSTGISNTWR